MYEKIEALLNFLIESVLKLIGKLIPQSLKDRYARLKDAIRTKMAQLFQKLSAALGKVLSAVLALPIFLKGALGSSLERLGKLGTKFGEVKSGGIDYKKIFGPLAALLATIGIKIRNWYLTLKPTTIALSVAVSAVGGIAAINIYKSSKDIYDKTEEVVEVIEEKIPKRLRSSYYKLDERHVLIDGVTMPIYIESSSSSKTLIMDFILQTSNRYLKVYLFENDHLVKDRLNSTLEPIIPTMPMNAEGKEIIRNKVITEVNELIKEKKIKGHIENIHFHSILAD